MSDFYMHLLIAEADRLYFRLQFEGIKYEYLAMPFGLGPRIATKFLLPAFRYLRRRQVRCMAYINDVIGMGSQQAQGHQGWSAHDQLVDQAGLHRSSGEDSGQPDPVDRSSRHSGKQCQDGCSSWSFGPRERVCFANTSTLFGSMHSTSSLLASMQVSSGLSVQ